MQRLSNEVMTSQNLIPVKRTFSTKKSQAPIRLLLLFWLIACLLTLVGLGDLPLRDFDEGTFARVALEISQKKGFEGFLPTLWDKPYLNKPPGLHGLVATAINLSSHINGVLLPPPPSEWVVRLVPALTSTLVVPLGGLIQWRLSPNNKASAIATAGILLTLLPVVRHGRLAMLDGAHLSAMALLWLLLLSINRSHLDHWRALGAGIAMSCMLLLKAPLVLPSALAALTPILWGKEFKQFWRWSLLKWIGIGLLPGLGWHIWHGFNRGMGAFWLWSGDGAKRVLFSIGEGSDLGWKVPLIEIFEGGWPWLLLWPIGIAFAWSERHKRWGRWSLASSFVLAASILPLKTQLPWYSHPLWLPFAIICAGPLSWLIQRNEFSCPPFKNILRRIPLIWTGLGATLCLLGLAALFGLIKSPEPFGLIATSLGTGWGLGGWLLNNPAKIQRQCGAISLIAGSLVGLTILFSSPLWLWELNENWPVKPVAELAAKTQSSNIAIADSHERPSLNWYAEKRIRTLEDFPEANWILSRNPEKFISSNKKHEHCHVVEEKKEWSLMFCKPKNH